MRNTMQCWAIDAVGGPLTLRTVPLPVPQAGQVLVKVHAVALNYRDKMVIENGRGLPLAFPFTPCSDLSGEVIELGPGATRFSTGERVLSVFMPDWIDGKRPGNARTPDYHTLGGYYPGVLAEYVVMPEAWLVRAPATLAHAAAATLPVAGLTAWFALVERVRVRAGDTVLITSTGGVALFGLQIAKAHGASVIVSGRADNEARARALGADHYVDSRREDWVEAVHGITANRGADHILEVVGGSHLGKSVQVAAVGAHIGQIGALDGFDLAAPAMPLMLKDVTVHGIGTGSRHALENLVRAVDHIGLQPVVDTRYAMADAVAAFDHLGRGAFGKIVIGVA